MSHIESVKTVLTDLAAVKRACTRLGVEFIEGKKSYTWYGRSVGGQVPEGIDPATLGQCDHVVKVPGVDYEIGLVANRAGKGFLMAFDTWGSPKHGGGLVNKFGAGMHRLVDAYSNEVIRGVAQKKGYLLSESTVGEKTILSVTIP